MNGIEKITARIESDAEQEIQALAVRTDEQVRSIRDGYARVAQQAYFTTLSNGKLAAQSHLDRMSSADARAHRNALLQTRQELLDEAFRQALACLCALPEEEMCTLLIRLAVNGCSTGREELVFSPRDRARYGKRVVVEANKALEAAGREASLTLSTLSRDIRGGLYVKNGPVENTCSFETILRLLRERHAAEAARILFE